LIGTTVGLGKTRSIPGNPQPIPFSKVSSGSFQFSQTQPTSP
jgi:hypothetical protein